MAKQELPPIPRVVAKADDIPSELRRWFDEKPDGWHLRVEDDAKLEEFRTNNRALNSRVVDLEATLKTYDGIDDPAAARAALEKVKALATDDTATRLADATTQLEQERKAHHATRLKHAVGFAFLKAGGEAAALDFIVAKAEADGWSVNDKGALVTTARTSTGVLLTIGEWLQRPELGFAYRPSRGGGSSKSHTNGGPPAKPTISADDALEFGKNLERIVSGDVMVR